MLIGMMCRRVRLRQRRSSCATQPAVGSEAKNAPLIAPAEAPTMKSGRTPCSASACSMPTSTAPRLPPPASTNAVLPAGPRSIIGLPALHADAWYRRTNSRRWQRCAWRSAQFGPCCASMRAARIGAARALVANRVRTLRPNRCNQSRGTPVTRRELTQLPEPHAAMKGQRVRVRRHDIHLAAQDPCPVVAATRCEFLVEPASRAGTPKPTLDSHLIDVDKRLPDRRAKGQELLAVVGIVAE